MTLISCGNGKNKTPHYATVVPEYSKVHSHSPNSLNYKNIISKKLIDSEGNFLGDNDENDIIGHPDTDYDNLTIWKNTKNRKEIYYNSKIINKQYSFFIENKNLLAVTEGIYNDEGEFKGDSIFFKKKEIVMWKNTQNEYVLDEKNINGKSSYLIDVLRTITSLEGKNQEFVNQYKPKNDSIESFVLKNLR